MKPSGHRQVNTDAWLEDDSHVSVTAAKSKDPSDKYSLSAVDLFGTERGLMRPNLIVKPLVVNLLNERRLLKLTPCPWGSNNRSIGHLETYKITACSLYVSSCSGVFLVKRHSIIGPLYMTEKTFSRKMPKTLLMTFWLAGGVMVASSLTRWQHSRL